MTWVYLTRRNTPFSPAGTVTKHFLFGGQLVAQRDDGGFFTFFLTDHLGGTNVAVDVIGDVVANVRYGPWGNERWASGVLPTEYQYTGQRADTTLGIYDYRARYYDPSIGRFLSADTIVPNPADPQSFNRYSYVDNNPLRYIDPTGHVECDLQYGCDSPPPNSTPTPNRTSRHSTPSIPVPDSIRDQILDATVQIIVTNSGGGYRATGVVINSSTIITTNHIPGGYEGARIDVYDAAGNVICSPCGGNRRHTIQAADGSADIDAVSIEFQEEYFSGYSSLPIYPGDPTTLLCRTVYVVGIQHANTPSGRRNIVTGASVRGTAFVTSAEGDLPNIPSRDGHVNTLWVSAQTRAGASGGAVVWVSSKGALFLVGINHGTHPDWGSFATLASHVPLP